MISLRLLVAVPTLAGSGLLGSLSVADEIYFRPEDGARVERTVSVALELAVSDYELTQADEPVEPGDIDESLDPDAMGGEWLLEFELVDAYEKSRRGRALNFVRTMVDGRLDGESMDEEDEGPKTVRFEWDEDAGDYTRTLVGDEEPDADDEEMLAGLRVDMDHVHLLPTGPIDPLERWEVELGLEGLIATVLPLFESEALIEQIRASAAEDEEEAGAFVEALLGELEGAFEGVSAEMLFKSVRPDEATGRTLANFDLEVDESMSMDLGTLLTDMIAEQMESEGGGEGPVPVIELIATIDVQGEGDFVWDQEGNHLHRMELPLEFQLNIDGRFVIDLPGLGEFEFVAGTATWDGEMTLIQTATAR